jgi:hypothetical protein
MIDDSHLDRKYFIDHKVYNCPFCNRNNVVYYIVDEFEFNWTKEKPCFGFITQCSSCNGKSLHLSYSIKAQWVGASNYRFVGNYADIDSLVFYSVPTSFFVLDERIPREIGELISEAEGCLKMNFLTGASACMRKAIYELLIIEKCHGLNYDERIKELKAKYKDTDSVLFEILAHIKDMTSDKVHEQSWDKWDSGNLKLIIETLKTVLHDIYVIPAIKAERSKNVLQLKAQIFQRQKGKNEE